jgi:Holliday junction resolvasome RuvABC endonuclease subunit
VVVTLVLGIDPGMNGAAALIRVEAGVITQCRAGAIDPERLHVFTRSTALVAVEAQHASPQMGVRSAFALGQAYGAVRGVLVASGHPAVVYVQPAVWRGAYGLAGGAAGKAAGIALARELLQQPDRALTHDEADAVLLAWWGWRNIICQK